MSKYKQHVIGIHNDFFLILDNTLEKVMVLERKYGSADDRVPVVESVLDYLSEVNSSVAKI